MILQLFAHNPLLRNHFLADYHNPGLCTENDCTCCEMDRIFTEVRLARPLLAVPAPTGTDSFSRGS